MQLEWRIFCITLYVLWGVHGRWMKTDSPVFIHQPCYEQITECNVTVKNNYTTTPH
jgi:hypothetical protein